MTGGLDGFWVAASRGGPGACGWPMERPGSTDRLPKPPAGQPPLSAQSCGTDDISLFTVTSRKGTAVGLLPFSGPGPLLGRIGKGCRPPGGVPMGRG